MVKRGIAKNCSAIITGASTGIGRALAFELARKYQANLVLNARGAQDLDATALEAARLGARVETVCGDVADASVLSRTTELCLEKFGKIDLLVNNAGLARPGRMTELTPDDWRYVFEVNFFAALGLSYLVLPHMIQAGGGKIVNVASVAGKVSFPGSVCYASSKFALTGFSEGMAAELSGEGIDVITVCPGLVRTEFFRKNKSLGDATEMAQQRNLRGFVVRNLVSISSEECARDIVAALEKGGSHEIVLTIPGKIIVGLAGWSPSLVFGLARLVPPDRKRRSESGT